MERETSVVIGPGKEYLVEARLQPLARQAGKGSVSELIGSLQRGVMQPQWRDKLVDALTTHETSWFRDREPYLRLTEMVVPDLLRTRLPGATLNVWSAACSTGQEPYSIAMQLSDTLPASQDFRITGTDVAADVLAKAGRGEFNQLEVNRGLPVDQLLRHFDRVGVNWRVKQALRDKVSFRKLNLATALPPMPTFDVVFLRNVLIYFDLPTRRQVLQRVRGVLRPGGWLFLGTAESTIGIDDQYERCTAGTTSVYRHRPAGASMSIPSIARKG
jgi:chemotaxis protein methyltransferase CheR